MIRNFVVLTIGCLILPLIAAAPAAANNDDPLRLDEPEPRNQTIIKLMRNSSSLFVEDLDDDIALDRRQSWSGGIGFSFALTRAIAIQPELLYSSKGVIVRPGELENERYSRVGLRLDYVELPLLFKFSVPSESILTGSIYFGPFGALKVDHGLSGRRTRDSEELEIDDNELNDELTPGDAGGIIGASLSIGTGLVDVILDARFTVGAVTIFEDDYDYTGNQTLSFSLGLGF